MRALVITGAGSARVEDVEVPVPGTGQAVVDVRRAGICGTDVELFTGQLAYFAQGKIGFPIRPGHEWCGVVSAVGDEVDRGWLGVRVTGDTMLGCGRCSRCAAGRGHVCASRQEVGIAGVPSPIDSRDLVLGDVTAVGILGASAGLGAAIEHYADGRVDPSRIAAVTVGLEEAAEALAGNISTGAGTKIHVDPCR
jgi:threonine dehydrogenase-like Zn-dependent dehydrogenase